MKKICAVWITGIMLLLSSIRTFAQEMVTSEIEPQKITIAFSKTTNLIFPYAIKTIDKGSRDVLVQKAIGVENVLQVKAGKMNFAETNLTIVTADGSLYSYILNYSEKPTGLNIKVQKAEITPKPVAVFSADATNDVVQLNAEKVSLKRKTMDKVNDDNNGALIDLKGLFVQENELYFQFDLRNFSALNYDIKALRFFIRDKKKSKRTASQEIEVNPVYILGNTKIIRSNSEQVLVVVVPKFTIPDKKIFIVQMQEQNGGRNLQLEITNKEIFQSLKIR